MQILARAPLGEVLVSSAPYLVDFARGTYVRTCETNPLAAVFFIFFRHTMSRWLYAKAAAPPSAPMPDSTYAAAHMAQDPAT